MPQQAIETIKREISARQSDLAQYHEALDEAAAAGDMAQVKENQANIAGTQALIESAYRRLEKAQAGLTEAEKAARLVANEKAVAEIGKLVALIHNLAPQAAEQWSALLQTIKTLQTHGTEMRMHFGELLSQLPRKDREAYFSVANGMLFADISAESWPEIVGPRMPAFDEQVKYRTKRFNDVAKHVSEKLKV